MVVGTCSQDLQPSCVSLQHAGDFICTVYLEEKKAESEQHIKVRAGDLGAERPVESEWARAQIARGTEIAAYREPSWGCV